MHKGPSVRLRRHNNTDKSQDRAFLYHRVIIRAFCHSRSRWLLSNLLGTRAKSNDKISAGHVIFFTYLSLMLTVVNVVVVGAVRLTEINLLKNKSSVKNWKVTLSRKFLRLSLLSPTFSIQPQTVTENTIVMKKAESRTKAALRDTRCVFKYLQHFTFRFLNP